VGSAHYYEVHAYPANVTPSGLEARKALAGEIARITERWAFTTKPMTKETRFTLTRIIKIGDEAWIDFSNELPEPNIPASAMKAVKA